MKQQKPPERPRRSLIGAPPIAAPTEKPPQATLVGGSLHVRPLGTPVPAGHSQHKPRQRRSRDSSLLFPKSRPERDEAYLAFVRDNPCCACAAPGPSDPHHYGPRGVGQKTDDYRTVPLCRRCHDEFHARHTVPALNPNATRIRFLEVQVELLVRWTTRKA